MTDPIDILAVAAGLRADAWSRVRAAQVMQQSYDSEIAYEQAKLAWMVANEDLTQVQMLAYELRA